MPVRGKMITAHRTRTKVLDLLEETRARRKDPAERAMIVDISATTWNWDTYAIVAGKPSPVKLVFSTKEELARHLPLEDDGVTAREGILVPQPDDEMVWMPKGAVLKEVNDDDDDRDDAMKEFVFEAPVDPNDDRLEHWEQEVVGKNRQLYKFRVEMAADSMRSMLRFYDLDRIVCWDLSWGIWEAVRDREGGHDESGYPAMRLVRDGKEDDGVPFPSSLKGDDDDDDAMELFYDCARPVSPKALAETLKSVSGYYLVGGNTYTMSLFHHMWDQQKQEEDGAIGHMQLLRSKLEEGTLFYMGHSAGLIMSGPNILTATFKGIDAFSVVTQPYNAPFLRLPPSETPETFFAGEKNDLSAARGKMLEKMREYGAWRGYRVVEALAFPHYDSRPRFSSFPQSAETYLRATDDSGRFAQPEASLLVPGDAGDDERVEPADVTELREATNAERLPCYPVANGHAFVMKCGGTEVTETLSPEEEGEGILHWDTYMPYVPDEGYLQFAPGRTRFTAGSFTGDADTVAGDRSSSDYGGDRIFSRLEALDLPNPDRNDEGAAGRLFRSE